VHVFTVCVYARVRGVILNHQTHVPTWEGRRKRTGFWWKNPKGRDHLEDQGVGGRTGSEWLLGRVAGGGGIERIQLAQDRGKWRALVNTVMNLQVLAPQS
jgi:hypothetical protein